MPNLWRRVIFGPLTLGSETPVSIQLKLGMYDYAHSPTPPAKCGGRREGGSGGHVGEVVPTRAFYFLVPRTLVQLTVRSIGYSLSAPKSVFRW